jgi:hypothetical protein
MEKSFRLIAPLTVDESAMEMSKRELDNILTSLREVSNEIISKNIRRLD